MLVHYVPVCKSIYYINGKQKYIFSLGKSLLNLRPFDEIVQETKLFKYL